ncbi:MAG: hypothetical protein ACJAY3_000587 [Neolewinella sp.]|jgi:hypothetical protein
MNEIIKISLNRICTLGLLVFSNNIAFSADSYSFPNMPVHEYSYPIDIEALLPKYFDNTSSPFIFDNNKVNFNPEMPGKFWGTGIRVTKDFPPHDLDKSEKILSGIKKLGFNHIRIVGLDFPEMNLFGPWASTGKLPIKEMNRICDFVNLVRKNGLFYSVSINHFTAKYEIYGKPEAGVAGGKRHKRLKGVQIIDDKMAAAAADWSRAIMSYSGGRCEISFAQDPANIYFTAVNEDSLFHFFNHDFKEFNKHYRKVLDDKFSDWLNTRYKDHGRLLAAWGDRGVKGGENLAESKISLLGKSELSKLSDERKRDTVRFLIETEVAYFRRIKSAVRESGFKGLFLTSNYFYGYGPIEVARQVGDATEVHVYFDRPRRTGEGENEIFDYKYIPDDISRAPRKWSYQHNSMYLAFASSLADMPLVISEWNHSSWSKYTYEGALMVAAYASLQGYPIIDLHTFHERSSSYYDAVGKSGLSLSANPVLIALMPTLSLAYMRGDIDPKVGQVEYSLAGSYDEFVFSVANSGIDFLQRNELAQGFDRRLNQHIIPLSKEASNTAKTNSSHDRHSAGPVRLKERILYVNTPRFKVVAGDLTGSVDGQGIDVDGGIENGLVSVISLSDEPINGSSALLLTAVSGFTSDKISKRSSSSFKSKLKGGQTVEVNGASKLYTLSKVGAAVSVTVASANGWKVTSFNSLGETEKVDAETTDFGKGQMKITFHLNNDAPWYLIDYKTIMK